MVPATVLLSWTSLAHAATPFASGVVPGVPILLVNPGIGNGQANARSP